MTRTVLTVIAPRDGHSFMGTVRTARKDRPCSVCPNTILKGQQYVWTYTHHGWRTAPEAFCSDH